jgi:VIT1/CCC1 family predicted Fe2+/Mn2+ transporter
MDIKNKNTKELIQEIKIAHKTKTSVEKYHKVGSGTYLRDMVYGANDGIITTFAVVAGVAGASLDVKIVLILGIANLIADGFAMATGNFLGTRSENQFKMREREMEEWEVVHVPDEEKKEIEAIFKKKGFSGEKLKQVTNIITSNKKVWVDEMMIHELGIIPGEEGNPLKNGFATFIAFVLAGFLPLIPYIIGVSDGFTIAIIMTGIALFSVGALRNIFTKQNWIIAGLEMLGVGAIAAVVAYGLGYWIESVV